jgi:hypothetical protein
VSTCLAADKVTYGLINWFRPELKKIVSGAPLIFSICKKSNINIFEISIFIKNIDISHQPIWGSPVSANICVQKTLVFVSFTGRKVEP